MRNSNWPGYGVQIIAKPISTEVLQELFQRWSKRLGLSDPNRAAA